MRVNKNNILCLLVFIYHKWLLTQLFGYKTLPERVKRQIKKYYSELNYSYSAIYKSLVYFFDIKKNNLEKANGGIGM